MSDLDARTADLIGAIVSTTIKHVCQYAGQSAPLEEPDIFEDDPLAIQDVQRWVTGLHKRMETVPTPDRGEVSRWRAALKTINARLYGVELPAPMVYRETTGEQD